MVLAFSLADSHGSTQPPFGEQPRWSGQVSMTLPLQSTSWCKSLEQCAGQSPPPALLPPRAKPPPVLVLLPPTELVLPLLSSESFAALQASARAAVAPRSTRESDSRWEDMHAFTQRGVPGEWVELEF